MSVDHDGHLRQPIFNLPLVQSVLKLSDVLERHTHIRLLPDPRTRRHPEPSINLDEVRPEPVGLELAQVPLSRTTSRVPRRVVPPLLWAYMISARGIMPITICIQKPVQPKREKEFARLSLTDGFMILLSA